MSIFGDIGYALFHGEEASEEKRNKVRTDYYTGLVKDGLIDRKDVPKDVKLDETALKSKSEKKTTVTSTYAVSSKPESFAQKKQRFNTGSSGSTFSERNAARKSETPRVEEKKHDVPKVAAEIIAPVHHNSTYSSIHYRNSYKDNPIIEIIAQPVDTPVEKPINGTPRLCGEVKPQQQKQPVQQVSEKEIKKEKHSPDKVATRPLIMQPLPGTNMRIITCDPGCVEESLRNRIPNPTIPNESILSSIIQNMNKAADQVAGERRPIDISVEREISPQNLGNPIPNVELIDIPMQQPPVPIGAINGLYDKYPALVEVEKYANERQLVIHCQELVFPTIPENSGIVCVNTYNAQRRFQQHKSFIIDFGKIIDKRVKLFPYPDANMVFEQYVPYSLFFVSTKNGKNRLDVDRKLMRAMFTSGIVGIEGMKKLYPEETMVLNRFIDLITVPDVTDRNKIIALGTQMCFDGVFEYASRLSPGSRWYMMKSDNEITFDNFALYNVGCSMAYGIEPKKVVPCTIVSERDVNGLHVIHINCKNYQYTYMVDENMGCNPVLKNPIE